MLQPAAVTVVTEETGVTVRLETGVTSPREVGYYWLCSKALMASAVNCDVDNQRGHEDPMEARRDDKDLAADLEEVRTKL